MCIAVCELYNDKSRKHRRDEQERVMYIEGMRTILAYLNTLRRNTAFVRWPFYLKLIAMYWKFLVDLNFSQLATSSWSKAIWRGFLFPTTELDVQYIIWSGLFSWRRAGQPILVKSADINHALNMTWLARMIVDCLSFHGTTYRADLVLKQQKHSRVRMKTQDEIQDVCCSSVWLATNMAA